MYPFLTYFDPRVLSILFLGFSSGLPFFLVLATLHARLSESGIDKTTIGLFVLLTLPYSFKFIWAPLIDQLRIPILSKTLGHRKSWMVASQICLILSLIGLGSIDPKTSLYATGLMTFIVAFCSATQDIGVEAYRVEIARNTLRGPAASMSVLGYRLGMWASGAGALYLAFYFDWFVAYTIMAGLIAVGLITTLLSTEPNSPVPGLIILKNKHSLRAPIRRSFQTFFDSFYAFLKQDHMVPVFCFILFYKIGDTLLNVMSVPFLLEIGFSKVEIAHVAKSFGISAMVMGGLIGGWFISKRPVIEGLTVCALLQMLSSLMFMAQAYIENNLGMLFLTLGIENLTCGFGTAVFVAYLSSLCHAPYTASQYALLSSFASFMRVILSCICGWLADQLAWITFYGVGFLACVPLLVLLMTQKRFFMDQQSPLEQKAA